MFKFKSLILVAVAAACALEASAQERTFVTSAPSAQQYVDLLFKDGSGDSKIQTRGIVLTQPPAQIAQPVVAPPAVQAPVQVPVAAPVAAPAAPPAPAKILAAPVRFAYNSAAVPADFEPYLLNLAEALKRPEANGKVVIISGHTDANGDAKYNMSLSAKRARSVELFLIHHGVGAQQVVSTGRGETQLIPGHEQDDALNRRVEFSVASF